MTTTDDKLLELVRSADPLEREVGPVSADADRLLQEILETPRAEEATTPRRRRRIAVRLGIVAAAAAAVFAAAALLGGDRDGATPASAAVFRHAAAALDLPPDTILHVDMIGTQDNGDGTTITWRDESWQQNDAPYSRRQVEHTAQGTVTESANVGDQEQVYDPATDTIYASVPTQSSHARSQPTYFMKPGPTAGTFIVRLPVYRITPDHKAKVVPSGRLVIDAAQAQALRDGTSIPVWKHPRELAAGSQKFEIKIIPARTAQPSSEQADPDPSSPEFRNQILALLQSGGAQLVGHATIDGRDTLEIRSQDGHTTYYVDPDTYAPVQLDTRGTDGGVSLRFVVYELLPANDANDALLSLAAQHPSATVDQDQADYVAAEKRIFPNG